MSVKAPLTLDEVNMVITEDTKKVCEILGIDPDTPDDEVDKAYIAMMAEWYTAPDNLTKQKLDELTKVYHRVLFHRDPRIKNDRSSEQSDAIHTKKDPMVDIIAQSHGRSSTSQSSVLLPLAKDSKMQRDDLAYAGFWSRAWATFIDGVLMCIVTYPILIAIYGLAYLDTNKKGFTAGPADFILTWVFPAFVIILFWIKKQATPGKMAISARIVDAKTGNNASVGQLIGRYFAYYLSVLPLGLGMIWVAFDKRKQGWHDKLAGTVVIRQKTRGTQNIKFRNA